MLNLLMAGPDQQQVCHYRDAKRFLLAFPCLYKGEQRRSKVAYGP
jgi:hypothetical protein